MPCGSNRLGTLARFSGAVKVRKDTVDETRRKSEKDGGDTVLRKLKLAQANPALRLMDQLKKKRAEAK